MTTISIDEVMYAILAFFILAGIFILWRLNRDKRSPINFIDLIAINGKLNERKVTRFGAWIVSTWGFVYLIIEGKFTEWYFLGYMGAWVANALIGKALKDKDYEEYDDHDYRKSYSSEATSVPLTPDPSR